MWFYYSYSMYTRMVEPQRLTDAWGWSLAALLALVSLSLPGYLRIGSDDQTALVITEAALFFSGVLMGVLRPVRVWRWPLASVVAFGIWDIVQAAGHSDLAYSIEPGTMMGLVASNTPHNSIYALPVLIGALAGASLIRAGLDQTPDQ